MMKYIYRFNQPRLLQVNDIINSAKDEDVSFESFEYEDAEL